MQRPGRSPTAKSTVLNSTQQRVFETNELLENIISFLPAKNLFTLQRVSKQWKSTIEVSRGIQEKMFLRLEMKPKETWTLDLGVKRITSREMIRFRRVDAATSQGPYLITPVTINPELQVDNTCIIKILGITCKHHGKGLVLRWGPALIRQHFSLLDTYISDPPCKAAQVCLTVRFQNSLPNAHYPDAEFPIRFWVDDVKVESEAGLTLQDVLRLALNACAGIHCKDDLKVQGDEIEIRPSGEVLRYETYSRPSEFSMREVIDRLPKYSGVTRILYAPLMEVKLTFLDTVAVPTAAEWAAVK